MVDHPQACSTCHPRHRLGLRFFPVLDELVVMTDDDTVVGLNSSARRVLELCDGNLSAQEIGSRLADLHGGSSIGVARDVAETLAELEELQLIHFGDPAVEPSQRS